MRPRAFSHVRSPAGSSRLSKGVEVEDIEVDVADALEEHGSHNGKISPIAQSYRATAPHSAVAPAE